MEEKEPMGDRIKKRRLRKGWSQRELARQATIDVAWVSRLETGERANVSLAVAKRLALALDVSLDYLSGMYDDPGMRPTTGDAVGSQAPVAVVCTRCECTIPTIVT